MLQKSILDLKLQHKNEIDKLQAEKEKDKRQSKQLKERIEHSNKVNFDKEKQQKEIAEDMKKKIKMLELKCAQKNDTEEMSSTRKKIAEHRAKSEEAMMHEKLDKKGRRKHSHYRCR